MGPWPLNALVARAKPSVYCCSSDKPGVLLNVLENGFYIQCVKAGVKSHARVP